MDRKKIVYVDMDGVLVDFMSAVDELPEEYRKKYKNRYDMVPGLFGNMKPMPGALEAFRKLGEHYEVYILSTAPWRNPSAWEDKRLWVERYLGKDGYKKLILSHNKHLCAGDYLIDDRTANGAGEFTGELIQFGTEEYPDWDATLAYLGID